MSQAEEITWTGFSFGKKHFFSSEEQMEPSERIDLIGNGSETYFNQLSNTDATANQTIIIETQQAINQRIDISSDEDLIVSSITPDTTLQKFTLAEEITNGNDLNKTQNELSISPSQNPLADSGSGEYQIQNIDIIIQEDALADSSFRGISVKSASLSQSSYTIDTNAARSAVTSSTVFCFEPNSATYPNFFDAEKRSVYTYGDSQLCWAATASNMLAWAGWGVSALGMTGTNAEDKVFDYFRSHFYDQGGWEDQGLAWYLSGTYRDRNTGSSSNLKVAGGGFYRNFNVSSYVTIQNYSNSSYMLNLKTQLEAGKVAGLGIYWTGGGGHAVTCWGIEVNSALATTDKAYITAVYISDSDDDVQQNSYSAPNWLKRCTVSWDADYEAYFINVPYHDGTGVALLSEWCTIADRPNGDVSCDVKTQSASAVQIGTNLSNSTATVKLTYVIKNNASKSLSNFKVTVYVGSTQYSTTTVGSLTAGASKTYTLNIANITASQSIRVFSDSGYNYWEANESNNSLDATFTWSGPSVTSALESAVSNRNVVLNWNASVSMVGISYYQYQVSTTDKFSFLYRSGNTTSVSTSIVADNGSYYWRVRAIDTVGRISDWTTSGGYFTVNTVPTPDQGNWVTGTTYTEETASASAKFGSAVAIYDQNITVGAQGKNNNKGIAYTIKGGTRYTLSSETSGSGDLFGCSVSSFGSTVVVGAKNYDGGILNAGAAYVYTWNGTSYVETMLTAYDRRANDMFGSAVAAYGNTLAISATGSDTKGSNSGSIYLYRWTGGSAYAFRNRISPYDGAVSDDFGCSLAAGTSTTNSRDLVIVGARNDDDKGINSGSVYIYKWDGASYVITDKLSGHDGQAGDLFGTSVAIYGDILVVGAVGKDVLGTDTGKVYVYQWRDDSGRFALRTTLAASDRSSGDMFGSSVSISGNYIIVGAAGNGDKGTNSGSSYIFELNTGTWIATQKAKVLPGDNNSAYYQYGLASGLFGNTAVVGSMNTVSGTANAGSVYTYSDSNINNAPSLVDQLLASNVTNNSATLNWDSSTDKENDSISYKYQFGTSQDLTAAAVNPVNNTNDALAGLTAGTTYYWRVCAVDDQSNQSEWSKLSRFTTLA